MLQRPLLTLWLGFVPFGVELVLILVLASMLLNVMATAPVNAETPTQSGYALVPERERFESCARACPVPQRGAKQRLIPELPGWLPGSTIPVADGGTV